MDEIKVVIYYQAKEGMHEKAQEELQGLVTLVIDREDDCLGIDILTATDDMNRFLLYERWTSKGAFLGDHLETSYILSFRERAVDIFAGPPEITFWDPLI